MKLLKDILYKVSIEEVYGNTHIAVEHLNFDSRETKAFSAFIATRGTLSDGHSYINQAIEKGAVAIICEELPESRNENVTYIKVANSSEALGLMASNFYDNPSEKLKVIAITGTNGKTTTATLFYDLLRLRYKKAGLISTVVNKINDKEIPASHTTPDAIKLNKLFTEMIDNGCEYCVIEASSHAIVQHRITGTKFQGAVFTNISHDHLDYHKTFDEYIKAKKALFDNLSSSSFALVNHDDLHGEIMLQNCKARKLTFGLKTMCDYKAKILENHFHGLHLNIDGHDLYSRLIGDFNAYNLLAVYAVAIELGFDKMDVLTDISNLEAVDGRFQYIKSENDVVAVVDYAHTPDALSNVLKTIKTIRTGNEKVITVVGCGGDRDREKRPVMARIAAEMSDQVILTSDNPRSEKPEEIINEMKQGHDPTLMRKMVSIADRREAIKMACSMAQESDIILIAGKGHEKYQEIDGVKHPFDDMEVVNETLKMLEK